MTRSLQLRACAYPLAAVFFALSSYGCAVSEPAAPQVSERQLPIVGGNIEPGWEAVGALTFVYPGYGYQGSFCTGTLIAPQWVLTAAHCLESHDDFQLSPEVVSFYIGTNAQPTPNPNGLPSGGSFYQADAFYLHPDYNPNDLSGTSDIGLMHLATPVYEVQALPYNTSALKGSDIGKPVLYVGFGVTDGLDQSGGGLKRSGYTSLSYIEEIEYLSEYDGTGVCFGDSGGPGLLEVSGQVKVIGVNARVGAEEGTDPCQGTAAHTRVDYFSQWIAQQLNAPAPNCNTMPGMCYCDAACTLGGTCDNDICQVKDCEEIYTCLIDCGNDSGCSTDCYITGTEQGKQELDALLNCTDIQCSNAGDADWSDCVGQQCQAEVETCFPVGTGPMSCEEVFDCLNSCSNDDTGCSNDCYEQGTAIAQGDLDSLLQCLNDNCADAADNQAYTACANASCAAQLTDCFPPSNCDVAGGQCDAGTACYPSAGGATDCFPSAGKASGMACDPVASQTTLECADGGICLEVEPGSFCFDMCTTNLDCEAGFECFAPIFSDLAEVGVCTCIDADDDGSCQLDDCDDNDATRSPYEAEVCGDNLDNDCDGDVDEGCNSGGAEDRADAGNEEGDSTGTGDSPGDNSDNEDDAGPGSGEGVGDDTGQATGEGDGSETGSRGGDNSSQPGCTDNDNDAFCAEQSDCDDTNAAINPAAEELCDGIDNTCDGVTDEGCLAGSVPLPGTSLPGGGNATQTTSSSGSSGCQATQAQSGPSGLALVLIFSFGVLVARRRLQALLRRAS